MSGYNYKEQVEMDKINSYKKVGIILVNYKDYAEKYLLACRDSLRKQSYPQEKIQIYIVDNVSNKSSFNFLQENYSEAIILPRKDGNYVAANNLASQQAIKDNCVYIVTANMDTIMTDTWLEELVLALERNPSAGIAQSKILLEQSVVPSVGGRALINTLGNKLHFLGFGTTSHYRELDHEILAYPEIKGYASGCSFIFRAELFIKINGWNENYFMYHDDIEFSWKTKLAAYKIILAPRSVIFHKYEFSRSIKMLYYMERNRYLFIFSFYPLRVIFLLLPILILTHLGLLVLALFGLWFKTYWRVNIYFWQRDTWQKIRQVRRESKKIQKLSWSELKHSLSGSLNFLEINNFIIKLANPILSFYWRLVKNIS